MLEGISISNGDNGFSVRFRRSNRDDGWILEQASSWVHLHDDTLAALPRLAALLQSGDLAALVEEGLVTTSDTKQLGRLYSSKTA